MPKYLDLSSAIGGVLMFAAVCLLKIGLWMKGHRVSAIYLEDTSEEAEQ